MAMAPTPVVPQKPQRTKLAVVTLDDEICTLATEVKEKLGYAGLDIAVQNHALKACLAKLEIEPFDPVQVGKYKGDTLRALNAEHDIMYGYNYWAMTELKQYAKAVPEFVLRKALQIHEELPNAKFFVDECKFHPDPFLVVAHGDEIWWIEVWDEPKFEAL